MEDGSSGSQCVPSVQQRLFLAAVPVALIAVGYVDPAKLVATIEGGARFGHDLVLPILVFNVSAVLLQYLSSCIGLVTGRNLAQICSDEYGKCTCLFLGFQAELSAMAVDLAVILGISLGLNVLLGVNLFTSMLLTFTGSIFFPLVSQILDERVVKLLCIILGGFILSYVSGVLVNEAEIPYSINWTPMKLNGENIFTFMSLLGASIMPHHFYLHSYLVQHHHGLPNVSRSALCHDNFYAILCIFSGIFVVNCSLVHTAANVFYNSGLIVLTFEDVLSLVDQVFRSPIVHFTFLLFLFLCHQISTSSWNCVGDEISKILLRNDMENRLGRVVVRMVYFFPAFYIGWLLGAEGIFQLLMFLQIMVALLLPSSVIPLLRIATSRFIMGVHKISPHLEFLSLLVFIGMISLKIMFVSEMAFGSSEWAGDLTLNTRTSMSVPYISVLAIACTSFCLTLCLAATPLKSERVDSEVRKWNIESNLFKTFTERKIGIIGSSCQGVDNAHKKYDQSESILVNDLPGTTLAEGHHLAPIEENSSSSILCPRSESCQDQASLTTEHADISNFMDGTEKSVEVEVSENPGDNVLDRSEKTVETEGQLQNVKDVDSVASTELESRKFIFESVPPAPSDSPEPFTCRNAKNDEIGSGGGSLSRLSGLGRAARRQLAAILDEFWGQLFDYHGHAAQEAKAKKLDVLLRSDFDIAVTPGKETPLYFSSGERSGSGYGAIGSSYFCPDRSPSLSFNRMKLLDAYVQNSTRNGLNFSERNYSSLHLPPSSDVLGYKSDTVQPHGNLPLSRNMTLQSERSYDLFPYDPSGDATSSTNSKKYHSMPDISGLSRHGSDNRRLWDASPDGRTYNHLSHTGHVGLFGENCLASEGSDPCRTRPDALGTGSMWAMQPFEKFGLSNRACNTVVDEPSRNAGSVISVEAKFLESFRLCIVKLLRLEGSDWLFRQNDGSDEDLIDRIAANERSRFEAHRRESLIQNQKSGSSLISQDAAIAGLLDSDIPRCIGECIWRMGVIISFGVWCIHRILELSLMESRPELWGKYTYVLNRLQGIIDLAFLKPRRPRLSCLCVQSSAASPLWRSPPISSNLPPTVKAGRGKCTTASTLLDLINDVEIAISCRKGRQGTAAGDVAFPKGRENLASVLKRYKRRLSGKQVGNGVGMPSQKSATAVGGMSFGHS